MEQTRSMYRLTQPLILCGFMASGKTATAKAIGKIFQSGFVDLDVQIEVDEGKSIPQIFEDHGEDYFRRIERRTVIKVINEAPKIISLGGEHYKIKSFWIR